jgi:small subunit ribosomal protein S6
LKRYETLFIVQVDLPDDEISKLIERYSTILTSFKGAIIKIEKWGKRKLAYEIRKQTNGYYVLIDYAGKSTVIQELERNFKIDDKILKFMTIMKDAHVDLAKIEQEKQAQAQNEAPRKPLVVESPSAPEEKTESETVEETPSSEPIQP